MGASGEEREETEIVWRTRDGLFVRVKVRSSSLNFPNFLTFRIVYVINAAAPFVTDVTFIITLMGTAKPLR